MTKKFAAVMFAMLAVLAASPARASLVTETFDFTASNFGSAPGYGKIGSAPPVNGSVSITFDPTFTYGDWPLVPPGICCGGPYDPVTTGITVNSFNGSAYVPSSTFPLSFAYIPLSLSPDMVIFSDEFILYLAGVNTHRPQFAEFIAAEGGTIDGTLTVTTVSATPLPAALPLFGTALAGLGGAGWIRRRGKVS
jgi:hypothetical protein